MWDKVLLSLDGLSVGDAYGECFFRVPLGAPPPGPWPWTDDTAMAVSLVETLRIDGEVEPVALAHRFARSWKRDPARGYGRGAARCLEQIAVGVPWERAARSLFDGEGSLGNGAAMRVAPLGAFLCHDLAELVRQAQLSALVTHAHPEGVAGAIAIAVAAACACNGVAFWDEVLARTPRGAVHDGIARAAALGEVPVAGAVAELGNGAELSAADTVPFTLWCAASRPGDYRAALELTVSGLGDRDTTCAIVGGIVALSCGSVPADWLACREVLA